MDSAGWSPLPESMAAGAGKLPVGPDASADDGAVVAIGAVCDVVTPWSEATRQVSFALSEFVDLESGKRVVLHSERGGALGASKDAPSTFTASDLRNFFLTVLLPDEGEVEDSDEPHPWTWLSELAAARGVTVTPEELKSLPYELEFSRAVQALVRPDE